MDGLSLVKLIREKKSLIPILVLSAKRDVTDRVNGLKLGADDFLTKPFSFSELLARLEALTRRSENFNQTLELKLGKLRLDIGSRRVWIDEQLIDLQQKEFDLLRYLMENAGRVVTKVALIENVWNFNFAPHTNIVETRICKLRDKLEAVEGDFSIQTIRGVGYVLRQNS